MKRRVLGSVTLILACLSATAGCSGDHDAATPTSTSAGSGGGTAASSPGAASPSTSVSGVGTYTAGSAHVGVVVNDITQIFPVALSWRSGELRVVGEPDAQGQFSAVKAGTKVSADHLAKPVRVAWLDGTSVLGLEQLPACSSSCATRTAPAGARYVVVQATQADRFEIVDGASAQVQLTKVNVPANQRTDLATSTLMPG